MDARRFDALSRSLFTTGSRRRALTGLLGGSLSFFGPWAEAAAAKNCKKIKNKKRRKTCLAKSKICLTGEERCKGACMAVCAQGDLRDPDTCRCCTENRIPCVFGGHCCSGFCLDPGTGERCVGRNGLFPCTWGAQCRSGVCQDGTCTCDGDICHGFCRIPCVAPEETRDWDHCDCCVNNGQLCIDGTDTSCCSGACDGPYCVGRSNGAFCSFDAQCASGKCDLVPDGELLVFKCV